MKPLLTAVFALTLAPAAPLRAEALDLLASYHSDNCCLPPEFAWETNVTIHLDGRVTLEHCTEYATEAPGCRLVEGRVDETALQAIRAAAVKSGLADAPSGLNPDPLIGGGGTSGTVVLDGVTITLPRDPAPADAARVADVLRVIEAAIPPAMVPTTDN